MITDDVKKRSDMARLNAELQAANIELLSAQCAADGCERSILSATSLPAETVRL